MKLVDNILSLVGLQRKIKEIDICNHKWFSTGDPYSRAKATVYCPECGQEKAVSWELKNRLIKAREIKEEYELNKQKKIDSLFQELAQNKNKEESQ